MILKQGNLWTSKANIILVTANASVRFDGSLVMGRGAASEAMKMYPQLPREMGQAIKGLKCNYTSVRDEVRAINPQPYGTIVSEKNTHLGIFQVKYGWWQDARLDLIKNSVDSLIFDQHLGLTFAVNFPGIGNGRLKREDVLPLLETLPDSVEVWEFA